MPTQRQVTVLPFAVLLTILSTFPKAEVAEASIPTINKALVVDSIREAASASLAKLSSAQLRYLQTNSLPSVQVLDGDVLHRKRLFVAQNLDGADANEDNTSAELAPPPTCYANCYSEHNDCGGNDI